MLQRTELEQYRNRLGFTIWQVERDYLQHIFLFFLSKRIGNELVFKGGTALQKTLALNRFSIDLDFTQEADLPANLFQLIKKDLSGFGCQTEISEDKRKESFLVKCIIQGPLYQGMKMTLTVLRIEISLREKIILEPDTTEVVPIYADVPPYLIKVMKPEEILAEKICTIYTRTKARDVYDLHFLLAKRVDFKEDVVNQKLKIFHLKYSQSSFLEHLKKSEKIWQQELSQLITQVPEYKEAAKGIKKKISEKRK